jgi:ribosomal protein S18 acetylase RimI-like enzyme
LNVRNPKPRDAQELFELERTIMGEIATDYQEVAAQLQMFAEGCFVAEVEGERGTRESVGVVSAVLWEENYEPDFGKLHGVYTHTHLSSGTVLFVHTIIVKPEFRRKGLGNKLLGAEVNFAALLEMGSILAVSSRNSLKLFERLGFTIRRHLPEFLPYHQDRFPQPMLMELMLG